MCSHAIFFKSLCFGPFTLKRNPRVLKTKIESAAFTKVSISEGQNAEIVYKTGVTVASYAI